jgi:ankyrin repeat protein
MRSYPLEQARKRGSDKVESLVAIIIFCISKCDGDGWTALRYACGKGFKDIVQVLIDNGAFLDECATNNTTSLDVAELYGHKEIMELLLLNGAEKKERFIILLIYISSCVDE